MPASSSCARCLRPLPADSAGGLCPVCLGSDRPAGTTPVSASTATLEPAPAVRPGAAETVSAPPAANTRTAHPDARTGTAGPWPVAPTDSPPGSGEPPLPTAPAGYDLVRRLGKGGMGSVYLAREHATERTVAMKFIDSPARGSAIERFLVEVRALAKLDHPNIVRVHATDHLRADPFFTMEYAPGGTLADRVEAQGPLRPDEAARLMVPVCRAIAATHAADIIHRDLKPSNVVLTADGTPKVSDFGLAKRLDVDDGITVGNGAMGTPGFMPPEQAADGGKPTRVSDVYGLGATLYYLVTGRPPLTGDQAEVLSKLRSGEEPPLPRSVRADLPPSLEAVVVRCLEKDPAKRYASAAEVADDLEAFLARRPTQAPPVTRRRRVGWWLRRNRRRLAAGAAALIAAVGLVLLTLVLVGERPVPVGQAESPDWEKTVAAVRKDLAAGRAVELTPKAGPPLVYRSVFEQNPPGRSSLGDDGFEFHAFNHQLLELFPNPGVPRYRVSLELRQLPSQGRSMSGEDSIGLYFGYSSFAAANGTTAHAMFAVPFSEIPVPGGGPNGQNPVWLTSLGFYQNPRTELTMDRTGHLPGLWFTPKNGRPGPWRTVIAEITPDSVRVRWKATADASEETVADLTGDKARELYGLLTGRQDRYAPGAKNGIPTWNPDLPFGVICVKSAVGVKNVVVTPIP